MNYNHKFNKERLSLSIILKDKKAFNRLKLYIKTELSCMLNVVEEGSFSRQEIELFIHQNETAGGKSFHDYLLLFQLNETLDFVFENYKKVVIDSFFMKKIHQMIFDRIEGEAGQYRKSKEQYPNLKLKTIIPSAIMAEMKALDLLIQKKDTNALANIFEIYNKFLTIAPFKRGNFYVAFILLSVLLLKNGYCPLLLRTIDKKRFFEVLEIYQSKGRIDTYHMFMNQALKRSFQMMLNNPVEIAEKDELLTISKFAEICKVPVSTIRYWMKEGQIKPAVFTSAGYALFSKEQRIDLQETKLNKMITKCMNTLKKGVEKSINQV